MNEIFQICTLALTAAVICVVLRSHNSGYSMLLSLAASVLILLMILQFLKPMIDIMDQLRQMTQLEEKITLPMMKVVEIGILSQLADDICTDAGEKALGRSVELGGAILSLYCALPLLSSMISMLQRVLRITS